MDKKEFMNLQNGNSFSFHANRTGYIDEEGKVYYNDTGLYAREFDSIREFAIWMYDREEPPHRYQEYLGHIDEVEKNDSIKIDNDIDSEEVWTAWENVEGENLGFYFMPEKWIEAYDLNKSIAWGDAYEDENTGERYKMESVMYLNAEWIQEEYDEPEIIEEYLDIIERYANAMKDEYLIYIIKAKTTEEIFNSDREEFEMLGDYFSELVKRGEKGESHITFGEFRNNKAKASLLSSSEMDGNSTEEDALVKRRI